MKTQTNEVAMKVNPTNLVNSLRFSFTNKTAVLGELIQNARRANATTVVINFCPETRTLQVLDDGCGIDSMATLLTVAESGWDADVIAHEHPFGIGFLSALFACRHISVISKSGSIDVETDHILAFKPVTITPIEDWNGITCITLQDVALEMGQIAATLKRLVRGFPVPVLFNDQLLERSCALDSGLIFVDTEIGVIYLHGMDQPDGAQYEFDVYLQGLPIYSSHSYTSHRHIIHLDSAGFHARLPDRDKLVDEADVVKRVKAVLAKAIEQRFIQMKATLSAEEFVGFYDMLRHWELLRLLNDVPVVPPEALRELIAYPVCDTEVFDNFEQRPEKAMTRADIVARGIVSIDDDIKQDGAARFMFAWSRNYLLYHGSLDKGHWLHSLVRHLKDEELVIETVNESHQAQFQGDWCWVYVRFCDAYRIRLGQDIVEIRDEACYQGQENADDIIVPKGDCSAQVLQQMASFRSEYDEFQESTFESDSDAFIAFVVANTASDPANAIQQLLPNFCGCPALYGKAFVVELDQQGKLASVMAYPAAQSVQAQTPAADR
ncbi:ATP-binding protein [Methylomonas sp. ZR1]|uniref:ATP-binding protein n=1 Tax=Methylomonas sp. ZR1 TaxID=1797072 RepID=UPI0020A5E4B6|nr:ATP-binding protein [Methylomonas sp. ZR1]